MYSLVVSVKSLWDKKMQYICESTRSTFTYYFSLLSFSLWLSFSHSPSLSLFISPAYSLTLSLTLFLSLSFSNHLLFLSLSIYIYLFSLSYSPLPHLPSFLFLSSAIGHPLPLQNTRLCLTTIIIKRLSFHLSPSFVRPSTFTFPFTFCHSIPRTVVDQEVMISKR